MLKNFIYILLSSTSIALAMDNIPSNQEAFAVLKTKKQKTPEEFFAQCKKTNEEFLSADEWLAKKHPHFEERTFSTHPLFFIFTQAKALADFEVDALEKFSSEYFQPHKDMVQVLAFKDYISNAMSAKLLLSHLMDALQDETSILNTIYQLMESRLEEIAEQSALPLNNSLIETVRIKSDTTDPAHKKMYALFARSYNTKNKIIRSLCDYLREKNLNLLVKFLSHIMD